MLIPNKTLAGVNSLSADFITYVSAAPHDWRTQRGSHENGGQTPLEVGNFTHTRCYESYTSFMETYLFLAILSILRCICEIIDLSDTKAWP